MFDFSDRGKALSFFDTDKIVKIGEAPQSNPIPCHLFVKDTQLFTAQTDKDPIFVYGELYTDVQVPTISKNVAIQKINPSTGEVLATYEGTPSRPIIGQSRKKYSVRFFDSVAPTYPITIDVEYFDPDSLTFVSGNGMKLNLLDEMSLEFKDGFTFGYDEYHNDAIKIDGTDLVINNEPVYFKNKVDNTFISVSNIDFRGLTGSYQPTTDPTPLSATVDYWDGSQWLDTKGVIIIDEAKGTFSTQSGFSNYLDRTDFTTYVVIDALDVKIAGDEYFYFRRQDTQQVMKCVYPGTANTGYDANFEYVSSPGE